MFETDITGENFNLEIFLQSRKDCIATTEKIISRIREGMAESDIKVIVDEEFENRGVQKFWHPTKIRIGSDTIKNFREPSNPDMVAKQGEICFLDVGPIINGHEADYGRTFLVGTHEKTKLIEACHQTFDQTAIQWKNNSTTGVDLFNYARNAAQKWGYDLNPMMAGHRLGDFPHKLYSSEKLFELNRKPTENLWVLEIHLVDKKNKFGAFFEDILGCFF